MARRTANWTAELAHDLQNPEVARGFLLSAIAAGDPLRVALAKTVRAMGVKEFAAKVHMESSNVQRAINLRQHPRIDTLERLLSVFGLRVTAGPFVAAPRRGVRRATSEPVASVSIRQTPDRRRKEGRGAGGRDVSTGVGQFARSNRTDGVAYYSAGFDAAMRFLSAATSFE